MNVTLIQVTPYPVWVNTTGDPENKVFKQGMVRFVAVCDFNLNYEFTVELDTGETRHYQSRDVYAYGNPTWGTTDPEDTKKEKPVKDLG